MRIRIDFCALLIILSCPLIRAQTPLKVKQVLGAPVSEVYQFEFDTSVNVDYGIDGQVCEIGITGQLDSIRDLALRIVPLEIRGRLIDAAATGLNFAEVDVKNYEKVKMQLFRNGTYPTIRVLFREHACRRLTE